MSMVSLVWPFKKKPRRTPEGWTCAECRKPADIDALTDVFQTGRYMSYEDPAICDWCETLRKRRAEKRHKRKTELAAAVAGAMSWGDLMLPEKPSPTDVAARAWEIAEQLLSQEPDY